MPSGFPMLLVHQYLDNNGDNAAGYLLYTYEAGTSTPKATYQDAALTIENDNPIVMDEYGRCTIFICPGEAYKLVFKDPNGVLIWTRDNWTVPGSEEAAAAAEVPVGGIIGYGGAAAPSGYLLCNGQAVSRATYALLFAVCGTTYGAGDGSTTFNVPDMRGRFPLGVAASGTGSTLGATAGQIDHVHTGPSHTHTVAPHSHTMAHTHTVSRDGWNGQQVAGVGTDGRLLANDGVATNLTEAQNDNTTGASSAASTGTQGLTTDAAGTGNTGSANPPLLAINFIIRTGL